MTIMERLVAAESKTAKAEVVSLQARSRVNDLLRKYTELEFKVTNALIDIENAVTLIKDRTNISVDLSPTRKRPNHIIVTGIYQNRQYVQVFDIPGDSLDDLIPRLREAQRYGRISHIDGPVTMKHIVEREVTNRRTNRVQKFN